MVPFVVLVFMFVCFHVCYFCGACFHVFFLLIKCTKSTLPVRDAPRSAATRARPPACHRGSCGTASRHAARCVAHREGEKGGNRNGRPRSREQMGAFASLADGAAATTAQGSANDLAGSARREAAAAQRLRPTCADAVARCRHARRTKHIRGKHRRWGTIPPCLLPPPPSGAVRISAPWNAALVAAARGGRWRGARRRRGDRGGRGGSGGGGAGARTARRRRVAMSAGTAAGGRAGEVGRRRSREGKEGGWGGDA